MNYQQTLDYLYGQLPVFHRVGAPAYKADLKNTVDMCALLDHPEKQFRSVHIAGTNGKGSTSHLMASVLQCAGYRTGLFTSPHLKDFRERIRIDGKKIPRSYVTAFVNRARTLFRSIRPSFFEYTAVMAFQYFREEQVDIAVIETGMGGRLDSTNVISPMMCVITNISKDHMAYLGDTLQKIAAEKAGIIKPGIPVVIGESQAETDPVFRRKAAEMHASIVFADRDLRIGRHGREKAEFTIDPGVGVRMKCPLRGSYQDRNLLTAYCTLMLLPGYGFTIEIDHIKQGFREVIKRTGLQGRWQVLGRKPMIICDVGHNEAGIGSVIEQLKKEKFEVLHWVFGLVNDKDIDSILRLLPADAVYYFCKADIPRGMDASELQLQAKIFGLQGSVYPSVKDAYRAARAAATAKDLVFVGGSTFIVAEVL